LPLFFMNRAGDALYSRELRQTDILNAYGGYKTIHS